MKGLIARVGQSAFMQRHGDRLYTAIVMGLGALMLIITQGAAHATDPAASGIDYSPVLNGIKTEITTNAPAILAVVGTLIGIALFAMWVIKMGKRSVKSS